MHVREHSLNKVYLPLASLRFGGGSPSLFAPEFVEKHIIPILVPPKAVGS